MVQGEDNLYVRNLFLENSLDMHISSLQLGSLFTNRSEKKHQLCVLGATGLMVNETDGRDASKCGLEIEGETEF